jgi:hypothetical protein
MIPAIPFKGALAHCAGMEASHTGCGWTRTRGS